MDWSESFLGQLTKSQYPVFTIYVQKNCLPSAASCDAAWSFERVMDHELDTEVRQLISRLLRRNAYYISVSRSARGARLDPDRSAWSFVWRRLTSSAGKHKLFSSLSWLMPWEISVNYALLRVFLCFWKKVVFLEILNHSREADADALLFWWFL